MTAYRFGGFRVELDRSRICKDDVQLRVEPRAFRVLVHLLAHRERVVSKQELLEQVWDGTHVTENAVTRVIAQLRTALGDDARKARFIETIPTFGYRFIGDVREERASQPTLMPSLLAVAFLATTSALLWYWRTMPDLPPARVTPLSALPGVELHPEISPDGRYVAFASTAESKVDDGFDIFVYAVDGTGGRRLTANLSNEVEPTWSPDGERIAFLRDARARWDIWTIPAAGGAERRVGSAWSHRGLAWAPDGDTLVFVDRDGAHEPEGLYRLSIRSGEKRRITRPPGRFDGRFPRDGRPAVSPDGKWVAFRRAENQGHQDLYVVSTDGGAEKRLTYDSAHLWGADWDSDGRSLVFASNRDGARLLWRIPLEGGEPERLSPRLADAFGAPAVSPSGRLLAYSRASREVNLYRIAGPAARTRSDEAMKIAASSRWDYQPDYAPDGEGIVFVSDRSGAPEIWTARSDGGAPSRLTRLENPNGYRLDPRWSPDGKSIVFQSPHNGDLDLYVIARHGGAMRRVVEHASEDVYPSWSKDGRFIYFGSNRTGEFQIWRAPAKGDGAPRQITRSGGFEAFESFDGGFLYYTRPDSTSNFRASRETGIWRVPVDGGEEVKVLEGGHPERWALLEDGICFAETEASRRAPVSFYRFDTGEVRRFGAIDGQTTNDVGGFAVSPDGRWLLFSTQEPVMSDVLIVENYR